jgi:branched-chain amino acid transport system substrate-binding protein
MSRRNALAGLAGAAASPFVLRQSFAQGGTAPGITKNEIKIGQTAPYSGSASNMSTMSRVELAYFAKINAEGGINGRKLNLISLDDGYSPPKTVEQTRRLVEQDEVAFLFHPIGTGGATAVARYLNQRKIPHLLVATGSARFHEPSVLPWSLGYDASGEIEGLIFGKFILKEKPGAKIAILYQNDDFGQAYLSGLRKALGDKANTIVGTASYEVTDPTVDSQLSSLKDSGADVFINAAIPKFAAQAIRKVHDMGWKPFQILTMKANFMSVTIEPAGVEKAKGLFSCRYRMDPADPAWDNDAGLNEWREFMKKYNAAADIRDGQNIDGYVCAQIMVDILKRCGDDLSRENIMAKATSINDLVVPTLIPGVKISTSKTDYNPIKQLQMIQFDGANWHPIGDVINPA